MFVMLISMSANLYSAVDSTKVLFIGNSITYFNNMPQMFRSISNDNGKAVSIAMHTPGGTGIVNHYVNKQLYSLIRSKAWDIVILQPGSSESAGASYPVDTTVKRARILLDSIYKNNPCTKVFLYEIPYGIPSSGGYNKYFQVQTMIRDSVSKMADSLYLQMLPAGESFRAYYTTAQNLFLHSSINNIHPNANGSYLVASTFYSGIFQDSVSNTAYYASVPQDSALKFFGIVDSVVLLHKADWRINAHNIHAEFTYVQNNQNVSFANKSLNFTNSFWEFGEGISSTNNAPNHTYNSYATFQVKLMVDDNQCLDSAFAEVTVIPTFIEKSSTLHDCYVYPNPSNGSVDIQSDGKVEIQHVDIYANDGRLIMAKSYENNSLLQRIDNLPKGVLFIRITTNIGIQTEKLVVY